MDIALKFEYTNACTCVNYDDETEEFLPSTICWGDCFEFTIEDFKNITEHLFEKNETNWWKINSIRLWDRNVSGFVHAKTPKDLLYGMAVNSEWRMIGEVLNDTIEYSLSHHDAPMGSDSVVEIITEEQREEWGLY